MLDEPSHLETSVRASRRFGDCDAALYLSRTHYRAPALTRAEEHWRGEYPRMNPKGISLSGPLWSGVLSLETGYYDSIYRRRTKKQAE